MKPGLATTKAEILERPAWLWYWLATVLVVAIASMGFAGPASQADVTAVHVPVVLDGMRYSADEFNQVNTRLHSQGVDLLYVIAKDGAFFAFTTVTGYDAYATNNGLPRYSAPVVSDSVSRVYYDPIANAYYILEPDSVDGTEPDKRSQLMTSLPIFDYAQNFADVDFGGAQLYVQCGAAYANLGNIGWNDRISSAVGPSSVYPDGPEYLYEHINFGGSVLVISTDVSVANFRDYGWNDRASSIRVIRY